jgi:hypothetical protein
MAVLYIYESPDARVDLYDRVRTQIEADGDPEGLIAHVACKRDGGGLLVTEVWETEAAHDRFNAELQEMIRAAGGPPRPTPRKLPVHNMILAEETVRSI